MSDFEQKKTPFRRKDSAPRFGKAPAPKEGMNRKPFEKKKPFVRKENAKHEKKENSVSEARMAALRALYDVYFANAYSNLSLDKQLRAARMSDEDKRLATNIFYQCVENRSKLDFVLSPYIKAEPEQIVKCILHIAAAQLLFMDRVPAHAAVNEAVNQTRIFKKDEASGFVNGVLRSLLRDKESSSLHLPKKEDGLKAYLEIEYSASADTVDELISEFGEEEAEQILSYKPKERFETVRVNLLKADDAQLEKALDDMSIKWERSVIPHAYRIYKAGNLAQTPQYTQGLFSLQGESAMLAALAVEPKRGMSILDACAAPGGKASFICELMQGTGRVHAWDLHEHRVELMKQNARRLGLDNLRCAVRDATALKIDLSLTQDAVIVDAPCSGLGVVADKPDITRHFTKARLAELVSTQKHLLDACCEYVKAGGLLVYSTCTLLKPENEEQVENFLCSHPDFKPEISPDYLPESLREKAKDGMIRLTGHKDGLEGFFIARLRRVR
jgi:16S rRNA (cytosine967-C5)-methyltransferase